MRSLITKAERAVFRATLNKLDVDAVEEVAGSLEELQDGEELVPSNLPAELPTELRKRLVAVAKQRDALTEALEEALSDLDGIAAGIFDRKDAEATANMPRCPNCQQILPRKAWKPAR